MTWDAVVIGLGGVGSFALRALTRQHKKIGGASSSVLGIERHQLGHCHGSSHGQSRIYRKAYFEHPQYVPWIDYSIQQFQELQATSSRSSSMMVESGNLILEDVNHTFLIPRSMASAHEHGIPVEHLSQSDLQERYPQFHYPSDIVMEGLLEPQAGFVCPEKVIQAAQEEASASGAQIWQNCRVESIQELSSTTATTTTSGHHRPLLEVVLYDEHLQEEKMIQARCVLIAAGAWTSHLIPSWKPYLTVTRQLQGWWDISSFSKKEQLYQPNVMPTWVMNSPQYWSKPLYGIPCHPDDDSDDASFSSTWIKLGIHHRPVVVDDASSHQPLHITQAEREELETVFPIAMNTTTQSAPHLPPPLKDVKACLYTTTPDEHFMIGIPQADYPGGSVFAIGGLSGHGFKMTPALGQMMADFAYEEEPSFDYNYSQFCSPERFL